MLQQVDAILFDLDGTLLHTAGDLVAALNAVMRNHGREAVEVEQLQPYVSRGAMALVQQGFGIDTVDDHATALWQELLDHYRDNLSRHTRLYEGMADVLAAIEDSDRKWGIVTNKPAAFTEPLLEQLGLAVRAACVVSGDTLEKRKPWPDPLLHACDLAGTIASRVVYIGDDERDIACGRSAGARTVAAGYGYIPPGENPADWGADFMIDHPCDLMSWFD